MNEKKNNIIRETANERLYSYGDYLNWNDEKRYELINGQEIMNMVNLLFIWKKIKFLLLFWRI